MLKYIANTCTGKSHSKNEDRIMINGTILSNGILRGSSNNKMISIICDGVGSCFGGDIAAELITKEFCGFEKNKISPASVSRKINIINHKIKQIQISNPAYPNMASTVAGIVIINNSFISFNLGDTRIYTYHAGKLEVISEDHVLPELDSPSNTLTRYMGGSTNACYPSIKRGILFNESYLILCSDGIYKKITNPELKHVLSLDNTLEEKQRTILDLGIQNGSLDDASLVLIQVIF